MVIPTWREENARQGASFRTVPVQRGVGRNSERLQVSDEVVFFLVGEHFFVGRHALAAFVNFLSDVGFGRLLAVVHFFAAEEALQARAHLLLGAVGVVAHGALLEDFLSFRGVTSFAVAVRLASSLRPAQ